MLVRELITKLSFVSDDAALRKFDAKLAYFKKRGEQLGNAFKSVGKTLSLAVTAPILAGAGLAVRAWDQQAKAVAQVQQALLTTGGQVGLTIDQLVSESERLQGITLFADEKVLNEVTARLLSFGNITGDIFKRTQETVLDVSARLGMDLGSVSKLLGRTLNDPVQSLSALSRAGVQFTEKEKKTIESLAKTNKLADAQSMILDILAKKYGGAAKAQAEVGLGPWQSLLIAVDDLLEEFGKIILDLFKDMLPTLKGWIAAFKALSPETKKNIVLLLGIAAALGPVLLIIGQIITTAVALKVFLAIFGVLAVKIALIVAAIVAVAAAVFLVYDDIKAFIEGRPSLFGPIYEKMLPIIDAIKDAWDGFVQFLSDSWLIIQHDIIPVLEMIHAKAVAGFNFASGAVKGFVALLENAHGKVEAVKQRIIEWFMSFGPIRTAVEGLRAIFGSVFDWIIGEAKRVAEVMLSMIPGVGIFRGIKSLVGGVTERAGQIRGEQTQEELRAAERRGETLMTPAGQPMMSPVGAAPMIGDEVAMSLREILPDAATFQQAMMQAQAINRPPTAIPGQVMEGDRVQNNEFKTSNTINVKVESTADPAKIGDVVTKMVGAETEKQNRQAARNLQTNFAPA